MTDDPRVTAARYRAAANTSTSDADGTDAPAEASIRPSVASGAAERAAYVETAIQQAIRRGEFDALPGAGKPIPDLGNGHDPDWWIRRKIANEQITGLGPPALRLRVEHAELDATLDGLRREDDVREALEDFNRRVIEARRQLLGGPPVVTPTRDVEDEVRAWAERRAARALAENTETDAPAPRPRRWRRRRDQR